MGPVRAVMRESLPPHWYRIHLFECVLCGRDESYRERIYGPKPSDPAERYTHAPDHACEDHFL